MSGVINPEVIQIAGPLAIGLLGFLLFAMTPFSNMLNVITVPLGYEWQSCPFCPEFGVEKITYTDCANCGDRIAENFNRSQSPAGESEWYCFCSDECHGNWSEPA